MGRYLCYTVPKGVLPIAANRGPALFLPHNAAIFDLDGTLLDSMWVWRAVDEAFFAARGLALPDDYVKSILSLTFRETAEYTIARFRLDETPEAIMDEWNRMCFRQYCEHVRLKPGVREYLARLKAQGVKLGTATSLTTTAMHAVLESNGVLPLFGALTSADEVTRGKEHPDIYLLAAQKLGAQPRDCVVFEDVLRTLRGIRAAGMTACAVWEPHLDQGDGYWAEMVRQFDVNIKGFEELL